MSEIVTLNGKRYELDIESGTVKPIQGEFVLSDPDTIVAVKAILWVFGNPSFKITIKDIEHDRYLELNTAGEIAIDNNDLWPGDDNYLFEKWWNVYGT